MKANTHIKAIRRLIRSGLAGYRRATADDGAMGEALEHYRRLLREDAARIRRAARLRKVQQLQEPAGAPVETHHANPAA